jgi:hypothetical protein
MLEPSQPKQEVVREGSMIRTIDFLCFLLVVTAGCAPSDPRNVEDAAPIGPLATDYQERVKADLSRSLADPAGAIYTFEAAPSIVNLGKRRAGVRYAWYVCGTVNARDPAGGYGGARPFLSVLSHNVVIDREIDTSRAKDCGK